MPSRNSMYPNRAAAARYRWGHLALLEEWQEPIWQTNSSTGERYIADTAGPYMWKLGCDCFHEFTIKRDEFPGRRVMRDCNREECQYARERRARLAPKKKHVGRGRPTTMVGATYSLYLPKDLGDVVGKWAKHKNLSLSAAVAQLLQAAITNEMVEDPDFKP